MKEWLFGIALIFGFGLMVIGACHSSTNKAKKRVDRCETFCDNHDGTSHIAYGWNNYCVCVNGTTVPLGR